MLTHANTYLASPLHHNASAGRSSASPANAVLRDQRPEALAQRKQIAAIGRSARASTQRALVEGVHSSPKATAQRLEVGRLFGASALPNADGSTRHRLNATIASTNEAEMGHAEGHQGAGQLNAMSDPLSGGMPSVPVAQRTVAGNIDEGDETLNQTEGYQESVFGAVDVYTNKIRQLDDTGDAYYADFAEKMSSGYKTWAENYYNKSQAYLYEAQKAGSHTRVGGANNENRFAVLGEDTDLQPDLTVGVERFEVGESGVPRVTDTSREAVEFKASTSASYDSVDKLFIGGMKQLAKREESGEFQMLRLELHNDNEDNHWPITDHAFENTYGSDFDNISDADFNDRLQARADSMAGTAQIGLRTAVVAEHGGDVYAEATVDPDL